MLNALMSKEFDAVVGGHYVWDDQVVSTFTNNYGYEL